MSKTVTFTDEETKDVRNAIGLQQESVQKNIIEDELDGTDLADAEREIACLERADKKLRENDTSHKGKEGETKMPKYEIKAIATVKEQRVYKIEAENLEKATENYGPEAYSTEGQVVTNIETISARKLA